MCPNTLLSAAGGESNDPNAEVTELDGMVDVKKTAIAVLAARERELKDEVEALSASRADKEHMVSAISKILSRRCNNVSDSPNRSHMTHVYAYHIIANYGTQLRQGFGGRWFDSATCPDRSAASH